jgi:hypothetical protein
MSKPAARPVVGHATCNLVTSKYILIGDHDSGAVYTGEALGQAIRSQSRGLWSITSDNCTAQPCVITYSTARSYATCRVPREILRISPHPRRP